VVHSQSLLLVPIGGALSAVRVNSTLTLADMLRQTGRGMGRMGEAGTPT
jgi:hypothetical protein